MWKLRLFGVLKKSIHCLFRSSYYFPVSAWIANHTTYVTLGSWWKDDQRDVDKIKYACRTTSAGCNIAIAGQQTTCHLNKWDDAGSLSKPLAGKEKRESKIWWLVSCSKGFVFHESKFPPMLSHQTRGAFRNWDIKRTWQVIQSIEQFEQRSRVHRSFHQPYVHIFGNVLNTKSKTTEEEWLRRKTTRWQRKMCTEENRT